MARVLIVDDEEADRLVIKTILESAGHELFFASDGEQALKIYMRNGIEVVLTDLQMPHVDGLELIGVVKDFLPAPTIIAISGKGPEQLAAALQKGAAVALAKPVDGAQLLEAVETGRISRSAQS